MQEAKILHCEDSETWRASVELLLSAGGLHRVVSQAESLAGALRQLGEIKAGNLKANVLLLDGHLMGEAFLNHPKYIIEKAKSLGLNLPVIGLSLEGLAARGLTVGRDISADILKEELGADPSLLPQVLDELPEPN